MIWRTRRDSNSRPLPSEAAFYQWANAPPFSDFRVRELVSDRLTAIMEELAPVPPAMPWIGCVVYFLRPHGGDSIYQLDGRGGLPLRVASPASWDN
jgi:hypothetical protein